jgi:hypothetical protein
VTDAKDDESMTDAKQDEGVIDAKDGGEDESIWYWNQLVENGGGDDAPNLANYMRAKSIRETVTEAFSESLDECMHGLHDGVEEMLQDVVVPIHEKQRERFDIFEEDTMSTVTSNHKKRKSFQLSLNESDRKWNKRYRQLMGAILKTETQTVRIRLSLFVACIFDSLFSYFFVVSSFSFEYRRKKRRKL